jgi:HNH endonuclease
MRGGRILRGSINDHGRYTIIRLFRDGIVTRMHKHQIIMLTFVGSPPEGLEIRHLDGNPQNDILENLKYGTHRENQTDTGKYDLPLELRLPAEELECEIKNCPKPQIARKMCSKHYNRWYKTGSPYNIKRIPNGGLTSDDKEAGTVILK